MESLSSLEGHSAPISYAIPTLSGTQLQELQKPEERMFAILDNDDTATATDTIGANTTTHPHTASTSEADTEYCRYDVVDAMRSMIGSFPPDDTTFAECV